MSAQTGDRVGAFLSANDSEIRFLGYGVLEGEFIVPKELQPALHAACHPNPRIKLDNGDVVWGFECYWGPEDKVKGYVEMNQEKGASLETISIHTARSES